MRATHGRSRRLLAAAVKLAGQKTVAEPQDLHEVIVEHYSVREPGYRVLGPTGERAARSVSGPWFTGEHNGAITWRHLLEQTSDWRGTLWDVPDWADRPSGADLREWQNPPLATPGTVHEYNDVRVNLLALALLEVLREPLPVVLRWVPEFEKVVPAFLEALRR